MFKTFLRSGFVTGVAIGLAIASPSYAARHVQMDDDPPAGGGGGGEDPVLEETPGGGGGGGTQQSGFGDYVAMRNEMQQVLFGDGTSFSVGYSLDAFPSTPGVYIASNDYQMFTLTVLDSQIKPAIAAEANLLPESAAAGVSNFQVSIIVAQSTGPSGQSFTFSAFAYAYEEGENNRAVRIVPYGKILSYPEMSTTYDYAISTPGSIIAGAPDRARDPNSGTPCSVFASEQERCICFAQANYDICRASVQQTLDICAHRAGIQFLKAALSCLGRLAFGGPFGWLLVASCMYHFIDAIMKLKECQDDAKAAMNNCYQGFRLAMEQCGILILELR